MIVTSFPPATIESPRTVICAGARHMRAGRVSVSAAEHHQPHRGVHVGGLTAPGVIRAATAAPAAWLDADDRVGTIEPGRFADLIAMPADPTADIGALRGIDFVMKAGVVVRDDGAIHKQGRTR